MYIYIYVYMYIYIYMYIYKYVGVFKNGSTPTWLVYKRKTLK